MSGTLNIAHRGGALLWPENTLFALENAAKARFDGGEIDVQLTRDGELAVFHDFHLKPDICRDASGKWLKAGRGRKPPLIRDLTYAELAAIDVGRPKPGSLYARRHRRMEPHDGEHIPLLREIIKAVRAAKSDFRLFIEIKTCAENRSLSASPQAVAEAAVAELRASRFRKHAVLVGFDWPALIHAKKLDPELSCWFTTQRRRERRGVEAPWAGGYDPWKFGGSIAEAIKAAGGDGWFASRGQTRPKAIAEAKRLGLSFGVWTVNRAFDMRALKRLGADAICTDRPDRLALLP